MTLAPPAQPMLSVDLGFLTEVATESERNPHWFSFAGTSDEGHQLHGLEHLTTLISSIGQTWETAYLTFWHENTPANFAQVAATATGCITLNYATAGHAWLLRTLAPATTPP